MNALHEKVGLEPCMHVSGLGTSKRRNRRSTLRGRLCIVPQKHSKWCMNKRPPAHPSKKMITNLLIPELLKCSKRNWELGTSPLHLRLPQHQLNLRRLSQGCGLPQQPLLPSLSPPMFSPLPLLLQEAPKWALQGTQLESMQLEPRRVKQLFSRAVIQCQESQEFPSVLPVASQSEGLLW